ncbi:DUF2844 domain-containing protein [Paraburkholderia nemoris]|uniref:DUF2844 domain-containing protein n=1 Tax=Paraburkholderia nemoris TaxID=2793076 RepID=UPI001B25D387|nr:DUF2844 domain-containing protein [Paraburkholderia nemoris]CAE6727298.1 hypothetical protein R75777_01872 [Paraburkholderia nemoris]
MKVFKIAVLAVTLLPFSSDAALGGAPDDTGTSSPTMPRATPQSAVASSADAANKTAKTPYTVREALDANSVTVREYVLPRNFVFAVTCEGGNGRLPLPLLTTNLAFYVEL